MADLENGYIPRNLDKPIKVLFWDLDVVVVFFVPIWFVGFILKEFVVAILLAVSLSYLFRKFKSTAHPKFLKHLFYWYLPTGMGGVKLKSLPPSHVRNFHS